MNTHAVASARFSKMDCLTTGADHALSHTWAQLHCWLQGFKPQHLTARMLMRSAVLETTIYIPHWLQRSRDLNKQLFEGQYVACETPRRPHIRKIWINNMYIYTHILYIWHIFDKSASIIRTKHLNLDSYSDQIVERLRVLANFAKSERKISEETLKKHTKNITFSACWCCSGDLQTN